MSRPPLPKRPLVRLLLGLLLVVVVMGVLLTRARRQETAAVEAPEEPVAAAVPDGAPRPVAVRLAPPPKTDAGHKPKPLEYMADGIPIMPANNDDPRPDGPVHPHPITPEHRRLYRENAFISGLNDAMDAGDPATMRRLLKDYRAEYPQDDQKVQGGYELIADCLEHPGAEMRARGQRYWEEERASILRRYVRRLCIEGTGS